MMSEAIRMLWRAKTRAEATEALNMVESCLDKEWSALSPIEFSGLQGIIKAKNRQLTH